MALLAEMAEVAAALLVEALAVLVVMVLPSFAFITKETSCHFMQ
jgi:hypothetical protein